jgi:hypothetical protein
MHHAFRNYDGFARGQVEATILEIDKQLAADHVEELIFVVVLMPMIFAVDNSEPDDRLVHFAQRLVVPLIAARIDERRDVNHFQRAVQNIEPGVVRESCR